MRIALGILRGIGAAYMRQHESLTIGAFEADVRRRECFRSSEHRCGFEREAGYTEPRIAAFQGGLDALPGIVEVEARASNDSRQTGNQQCHIELDLSLEL